MVFEVMKVTIISMVKQVMIISMVEMVRRGLAPVSRFGDDATG